MSDTNDVILNQLKRKLSATVEEYKQFDLTNKNLKVSNESSIAGIVFLGAMFFIGWGLQPLSEWLKKRSNKKAHDQSEVGQIKKSIEQINKTFLNDAWLNKQEFKTGNVGVPNAEIFLINDKLPANILDSVYKTFNTITNLDRELYPDYNKFVTSIISTSKPLEDTWNSLTEEKFLSLTAEDKNKFKELLDGIEESLNKLTHPLINLWVKLPDYKSIMGNLHFSLINDKGINYPVRFAGYSGSFQVSSKAKSKVTSLPALTKGEIKQIGKLLKDLSEYKINSKDGLFPKSTSSVNAIPMPQDGWPYEHISGLDVSDVFPDIAMGTLGDLGALNEQLFDPIYTLEWQYEKALGEIQTTLLKWVESSIENKD